MGDFALAGSAALPFARCGVRQRGWRAALPVLYQ